MFMALAMLLSYSFVVAPVVKSASDGDLIKGSGSAVYYLNGGKRYVFPNQKTYMTWYPDFSGVVVVSDSELSSYPLGGNVTYRAGTKMVKIDTVPTVYAVEPGGVLRSIVSEANAAALYGANWNKKIDDVPDSFWVNYTVGDDLTAGNYPTGTIVKETGSATTYYVDGTTRRPVATGAAFDANNFNWSYLVTATSLAAYSDGASITGAETALTTVAGTGGGVVGGNVTVAIASDTPASTTYMINQARAEFLYVNVVNGGSTDVTIDSMTIERGGLALDADLASVTAYEDSVTGTQIGLNKTLNSDHRATIGDDVVVKAGTTKKIILAGNIASGASSGNTPKLGLYSMALKNDATLSGTLPIWGNTMSLNTSVTIATVKVGPGPSNPTTDSAPKVGETNVEIAEFRIQNGSATEEVQLEKLIVKQAGTIADSDVTSYILVDSADGTVLATAPQVDKYVQFVFSTPFKIGKSKTKDLMVKALVVDSGSSRTIQLDIYRNTDVVVKTLTYNTYRTPAFYSESALTTAVTSQPYVNNTINQTIGNGTLKIEPDATFVAKNIAEGQNGVQLGQWLVTVKGEGVDITNIEGLLTVAGTGTGKMADITGAVFYNKETGVGLTGSADATGGEFLTGGVSSTDTISLPVGVYKLGLKANLNSYFANNDTIVASIDPDTDVTATGQVTGNTITATPASYQNSATLTIKAASVSVSASTQPAAATIIRGTNGVVFANIQFDASASGDDISISQLKTVIHTTASGNSPSEISGLKIYDGTKELTLTNNPDPTSTTAGASVTTTWTFSPVVKITKGTVKTLKITANVASTPSANETFAIGLQSGCTVTSKDSNGEDATETYTYSDGQTMTIQTAGGMTLTRSDELEDSFVAGSTSGLVIGKFKAKALYEDAKIEQVYVDFASYNSGGTDELTSLYLYDGAAQIAVATITSSNAAALLFNMESAPYTIPVNTEKELTLKADTGLVDESGASTSANPLEGFTPTINSASMTVNSNYDLIDVTVAADSKGPVGLYKMTFSVATTTVKTSSFQVYEGTTLVATENTTAATGILKSFLHDGSGGELLEVYFNNGGALGGRMREIAAGSSKTYTLKATVTNYTSNVSNGISTSVTGDDALAATTYTLNAAAVDAVDDDDFIWSDLSYGNTSTTATTTVEWMNGYLVGGLLTTTSSAKSI